MLIDDLQERCQNIKMVEAKNSLVFRIENAMPILAVDGEDYYFSEDSLYSLLNEVKIPIKYFDRLVEAGSYYLAEMNLNHWLQHNQVKFIHDGEVILKTLDSNRIYVPSLLINDAIVDFLEDVEVKNYCITEDGFHALYITPATKEIGALRYRVGIRILFSECFNIAPRFDAVLYNEELELIWAFPVPNRKFKSSNTTISSALMQAKEFAALAIENMESQLENFSMPEKKESYGDIVHRLYYELRLSRVEKEDLMLAAAGQDNIFDISLGINAILAKGHIDLATAREMQVCLTNYVLGGSFK